jgi:hypothetical protein
MNLIGLELLTAAVIWRRLAELAHVSEQAVFPTASSLE